MSKAAKAKGAERKQRMDTSSLMEQILSKDNLNAAYLQVVRNKGAAGVDGMTVEELGAYLSENGESIREQLRTRRYKSQPVRRVEIPKPDGGVRNLGVPTVVDRFVQQAVAQVLTPIFEKQFHDHSYGFRPKRCAQQAVLKALEMMNDGHSWIVDIDLAKFFDTVDHDKLMTIFGRTIKDGDVISVVRKFLVSDFNARLLYRKVCYLLSWLNRRVPNGTHGGVRGRGINKYPPPTRFADQHGNIIAFFSCPAVKPHDKMVFPALQVRIIQARQVAEVYCCRRAVEALQITGNLRIKGCIIEDITSDRQLVCVGRDRKLSFGIRPDPEAIHFHKGDSHPEIKIRFIRRIDIHFNHAVCAGNIQIAVFCQFAEGIGCSNVVESVIEIIVHSLDLLICKQLFNRCHIDSVAGQYPELPPAVLIKMLVPEGLEKRQPTDEEKEKDTILVFENEEQDKKIELVLGAVGECKTLDDVKAYIEENVPGIVITPTKINEFDTLVYGSEETDSMCVLIGAGDAGFLRVICRPIMDSQMNRLYSYVAASIQQIKD